MAGAIGAAGRPADRFSESFKKQKSLSEPDFTTQDTMANTSTTDAQQHYVLSNTAGRVSAFVCLKTRFLKGVLFTEFAIGGYVILGLTPVLPASTRNCDASRVCVYLCFVVLQNQNQ